MMTVRFLAFGITQLCLAAGGGCDASEPAYHADSLEVGERYSREIHFEPIGVRIPLPKQTYVRIDPPVDHDLAKHRKALLSELGIDEARTRSTNEARMGSMMHLRFRDGKECAFILVKKSSDPRMTHIRREHEKYHALCRLAPEKRIRLTEAIRKSGFDVELASHDEELAATIVEVVSLHRLGAPLDRISSGSQLVQEAVTILEDSRKGAPQSTPADPTPPMHVGIGWPQGTALIELPLGTTVHLSTLECSINGTPSTLIVDTGSAETYLYVDRLKRLGIELIGKKTVMMQTAGGTHEARICGEHAIAFEEGLHFTVSAAFALPGRYEGHDVDGVLGVKVMRSLNGTIDLGKQTLVLQLKQE